MGTERFKKRSKAFWDWLYGMSVPLCVHLWSEVTALSVVYLTCTVGFSVFSCDIFSGAKSIQRLGRCAWQTDTDTSHIWVLLQSESSSHFESSPGFRVRRLVPWTLDPWWHWHQQQLSGFKHAALGGRGPAERPKESSQPLHCHPWVVSVWECHSEWKQF